MNNLSMDFATLLLAATVATGLIWLIDTMFFRPRRLLRIELATEQAQGNKIFLHEPKLVEYCRSFFPILVLVLLLRSFLVEPFRIPTGSMKPTLLDGDFILVNKYTYGLRLPVSNTKILDINYPQRGDVIVFKYPLNPKIPFIKRVIGLPGDTIRYANKTLSINGKEVSKNFLVKDIDVERDGSLLPTDRYVELLTPKLQHDIFIQPNVVGNEQNAIIVPAGYYFVMGDNRDNSEDSRVWGFVPDKLVLGKAFATWLSWDNHAKDIRWHRMAKKIQ